MATEDRADWLSYEEAREAVLAGVAPLPPHELPLERALGHVLARDVVSPVDLPPWDNSGMDGYAVRAEDVRGASADRPTVLRVIEDVPAGSFPSRPVSPGTAARVMTGAPLPAGADGVIRVEHTRQGDGPEGDRVWILSDEDAGRNARPRGQDVARGSVVLERGRVLRAASLGMAAAVGRSRLSVVRNPVVGVLSSGDELVEVEGFDEVLAGRRIVSSNGYALAARLAELGMEARPLGIARDDPTSLREHLLRARGCDALVTSAGVSVGEHDHVRGVLRELGLRLAFWRVRMRPGSPFAFGHLDGLGGIPWFGLPGNPVSALVTFEVLARPALLRMAGHPAAPGPVLRARLLDDYPQKPGLTHFPRVRLHLGDELAASLTGAQGSGLLSSLVAADALLVVPPDRPGASAGERLEAIRIGTG
jgi:molybdopterin molybdotransferase